jgi:hypothetical protein
VQRAGPDLAEGGDVGDKGLAVRLGGGADEAGELENQHQDQPEERGDGHGEQGAEGDADGGEQGQAQEHQQQGPEVVGGEGAVRMPQDEAVAGFEEQRGAVGAVVAEGDGQRGGGGCRVRCGRIREQKHLLDAGSDKEIP